LAKKELEDQVAKCIIDAVQAGSAFVAVAVKGLCR
jgi:hypothetical protein